MKYEDIHLEDKSKWNQFQKKWNEQNYQSALGTALYSVFLNKRLDAASINDITSELLKLQKQGDASFKVDKIVVSTEPPTDLADGKVYFKMLGPTTGHTVQNSYFIEILQKNGTSYDTINPYMYAINMQISTALEDGGRYNSLDELMYDLARFFSIT